MVIAAGLSALVFAGIGVLLVGGMSTWIMGEAKVDAESTAELGIRTVTNELRSAMLVTVDSNGLGLTYELPAKDSSGNYVSPLVWDGVSRRFALANSTLYKSYGGSSFGVVTGVTLTDPLSPSGTGTYQIFTPNAGAITRQITVELVTVRDGVTSTAYNAKTNARNRETIYLRNVPQISR
jgi:hypothetical protein